VDLGATAANHETVFFDIGEAGRHYAPPTALDRGAAACGPFGSADALQDIMTHGRPICIAGELEAGRRRWR